MPGRRTRKRRGKKAKKGDMVALRPPAPVKGRVVKEKVQRNEEVKRNPPRPNTAPPGRGKERERERVESKARASRERDEEKGRDKEDKELGAPSLGPWKSGTRVDGAVAETSRVSSVMIADRSTAATTVEQTEHKKKGMKVNKTKTKRPLSSPVRRDRKWFGSVSSGSGGTVDQRLEPSRPPHRRPRKRSESPLLSSPANSRDRWIRPLSFLTETGVDLAKKKMWVKRSAPQAKLPISVPAPGAAGFAGAPRTERTISSSPSAMVALSVRLLERPSW